MFVLEVHEPIIGLDHLDHSISYTKAMFVSGVNGIGKIFHTLKIVWVHMYNMVKLKITFFDCKI